VAADALARARRPESKRPPAMPGAVR